MRSTRGAATASVLGYVVATAIGTNPSAARAEEQVLPSPEAAAAKPEAAKPEAAKPEAAKPEAAKPEAAKTEKAEPTGEDRFLYEMEMPQDSVTYDTTKDKCTDTPFIIQDGWKFFALKTIKTKTGGSKDSCPTEIEQFVIKIDNQGYVCLDKGKFDSLLTQKGILKKYRLGSTGPVYGLNFNLPFKLRRAIPGFNTALDQGIQIAGSLGWRWRISSTRDYHIDFPVVSAGLTTLNIEMGTAPSAKDGNTHTLGVTAGGGVVLELSDFQLGLMTGIDRATGDVGRDWRYNGKFWYSFSVGYSFLKSDSK